MAVYNYSTYGCRRQVSASPSSNTPSPNSYLTTNKSNFYNYNQPNDSLSSSSSASSIKDFTNNYNDNYTENSKPTKTSSSILVDYYNCKSELNSISKKKEKRERKIEISPRHRGIIFWLVLNKY